MQLSFLDNGASYLYRSQQNRERMVISHFALGAASNYVPISSAVSFRAGTLYKAKIDAQAVSGDSTTFTCVLPLDMALTFGELAVLSPEGGLVGLAVLTTPLVKVAGTQMQLVLEMSAPGLGSQLTFVTSSVFLSRTRPDYNDILLQLQRAAIDKDNFNGLVTNETGNALLELMAGIADLDSYMFESALQEGFPDTAKLDSSQYATQVMLSNRLTRKQPAGASVMIKRPPGQPTLTINPFTEFVGSNVTLFNRDAIKFLAGQTTTTVRLFEGTITELNLQGQGTDYQFFVSADRDFTVSDLDVSVSVGGNPIVVVTDPLWNYAGRPAVRDFTDKYGRLTLAFGNATLGSRPSVVDTITIKYATTKGAAGNEPAFTNEKLTCAKVFALEATAVSALTGGGNQPSTTLYSRMGGDLYGSQRGATTPSQYRARARQYPGVIDAVVLAQRDLAPTNKDWFNVGKVILLTQTPWTQVDRDAYESWYRSKTMYSMRYQIKTGEGSDEPRKKPINVVLKVSCRNDTDLTQIQSLAEGAVKSLFLPRAGILSRDMYMTDITDAVKAVSPDQIDYVELSSPTIDVGMDIYAPRNIRVTVETGTGGTIPKGNYVYGLSCKDDDGKTPPLLLNVSVPTSGSSVTISWDRVPAAKAYLVYGRTATLGLIKTVTDALSWVDTGVDVGTGEAPVSINTSGVHYATLGTLDVVTQYSRRRSMEDLGYGVS